MDDFWLILGAPIIVLIIGLVIEYWVIQPIKISHEFRNLPERNRRDWITATSIAIKALRKKQPDYNGILRRRNIQIEEKEVKHGHAIIKIGISEKRYIWENITSDPQIIQRVELIIDRTGDILSIKQLFVALAPPVKKTRIFAQKEETSNHPRPYAIYLYVIVGLLGGSGGLASATILYFLTTSQPSPENDAIFWGSGLIALLFGAGAALYADIYFQMDQAYAWQRLPIALILGILAGALGIVAVCIGSILLILWVLILYLFNKWNT